MSNLLRFLSEGDPTWNSQEGDTPIRLIMDRLGSKAYLDVLRTLERGVNSVKMIVSLTLSSPGP